LVDDDQVHGRIEQLVSEEHALLQREAQDGATDDDRRRLEAVRVTLDQCWDLLRQRQGLREAKLDPEDASVRRADVVERYQQ